LFACITVLKMGAWMALTHFHKVRPFPGDNATALYIPIAQRMLAEHRFNGPDSRPDSKVPPAYSLTLAGEIAIAPNAYQSLTVALQMLADLATAFILFWTAWRIGQSRVGLWAGCVWLLFPPALAISTWITAETIFTTLFTLGLALLAISFVQGQTRLALAGGVAMGVATLFRGTPLWLPVALVPAAFWSRALRRWLLFAVAMAACVVPWTIRNWIVLHDFIPVAVGSGSVVLMGADERFFTGKGKATYYPETFQAAANAGIRKPADDRESQIDGWLSRVGVWVLSERLKQRPLSAIPFFAHKFVRLWYGTESAAFRQQLFLGFCSLLVVPAGLWQFWKWRKSVPGLSYVFLWTAAYMIAMHIATLPEIRYSFPLFPILILGACQQYFGKRTTAPVLAEDISYQRASG
jgi:4-amino-4-deoxy-L-arabinose transferase-like glycosyltransferase